MCWKWMMRRRSIQKHASFVIIKFIERKNNSFDAINYNCLFIGVYVCVFAVSAMRVRSSLHIQSRASIQLFRKFVTRNAICHQLKHTRAWKLDHHLKLSMIYVCARHIDTSRRRHQQWMRLNELSIGYMLYIHFTERIFRFTPINIPNYISEWMQRCAGLETCLLSSAWKWYTIVFSIGGGEQRACG